MMMMTMFWWCFAWRPSRVVKEIWCEDVECIHVIHPVNVTVKHKGNKLFLFKLSRYMGKEEVELQPFLTMAADAG
jgi:hypothetical protein